MCTVGIIVKLNSGLNLARNIFSNTVLLSVLMFDLSEHVSVGGAAKALAAAVLLTQFLRVGADHIQKRFEGQKEPKIEMKPIDVEPSYRVHIPNDWVEIESEKLAIVDYTMAGCPPCTALKPLFAKLAREYGDRIKFFVVDVLDFVQMADDQLIDSTPTLIVYEKGKKKAVQVGNVGEQKLRAFIEKQLK